ncbi:hypothetical protein CF326_g7157 [Tilletia indica]|nr:hypothetical protein CF326_g7157 [Tilletia indica]
MAPGYVIPDFSPSPKSTQTFQLLNSTPPFTPRASLANAFSRTVTLFSFHCDGPNTDTDTDYLQDGRRTPTQDRADHNDGGNASLQDPGSPDPAGDLNINIPGQGNNKNGSRGAFPRRISTSQSASTVRDRQHYVRPQHNLQPSFHPRENFHLRSDNNDDTPHHSSAHYSARPNSYHRKSVSGMSTRSNTTIGDEDSTSTAGAESHYHNQGRSHNSHSHPQTRSNSHSEHAAHGRGSTGFFERGGGGASDRGGQTKEKARLDEDTRKERYWKRCGPYLAERQWATVREDYSANGDAWSPRTSTLAVAPSAGVRKALLG